MFVQVVQGQVSDAGEVRAAMERWMAELAPGAIGWIGSTAGVTEDGTCIATARFDSEESARRNSDRPEQDQWWTETSKLFTGEVAFKDSTSVMVDLVGDPDDAGFVQIIQGRSKDQERASELMSSSSPEWAAFRPDILGSVGINHEGGEYTAVLYFTSEAEAREGEAKELPEEFKPQMDEMMALEDGEPRFFDLKDPWLHSPA